MTRFTVGVGPDRYIGELYAWLAVDPETGREGIMAAFSPSWGGWRPLVMSSRDAALKVESQARELAAAEELTCRLVKFETRIVVRECEPSSKPAHSVS